MTEAVREAVREPPVDTAGVMAVKGEVTSTRLKKVALRTLIRDRITHLRTIGAEARTGKTLLQHRQR